MDVDRIERKMEEKKVYIKRVFHVREIGVFGSFIRGEQTESSDIDVLVEFEKGHKDFFNYYFGIDLEAVWDTVRNNIPSFKKQVVKVLKSEKASERGARNN